MIKTILISMCLLLSSSYAYAEDSSGEDALIYDSSGNSLNSTSNALNTFVSNFPATQAVTQSTSPWVVSGTITSNQGTSPWVTNVSQFGGSNVVTGTGVSGSGIPRVTVSNDSNILATQSGTWTTGRTWTLSSGTDSVASVQSGTWTVQQGTPPWTIQGDSASGASKAGNPVQIGGVFNTTQPTVTTGQTVEVQSTARGAQIVATGVDAFAVNATQTGTWTVQQGTPPWSVSQSGTWTVQQGTPPWTMQGDSASGASKAGNPVQIGGVFNTTQPTVTTGQTVEAQSTARGAQIVATGVDAFAVNASQAGTWTVQQGSAPWSVSQSGTWNINNISGTVSLPTGASTEATLAKLAVAQGSTTSGQSGTLTMGAVTTAAPAYTTAQTSPLSLTTAGALRVDGSGVTQPVSGTVTANQGTSPWVVTSSSNTTTITYSAAVIGFVPPAAATDVFTITGSGTKTILVNRMVCSVSTTAGSGLALNVNMVVRSTANSAGTSTTMTNVPHDSNNAAGTATVRAYTANPTLGTLVGAVRAKRSFAGTAGSSEDEAVWEFGTRNDQPITLRGTSQVASINFNGTTITNPVADCSVEWTEQ